MYVHVYALLSFKLQIDIDVIQEISDNDLEKYLQCKGDRIAVKAFASEQKNKDTDNERKLALIDSLRKRMGVPNMSDTDDEETTIRKKRPYSFSRKFKKRKQAEIASDSGWVCHFGLKCQGIPSNSGTIRWRHSLCTRE